MLNDNAAKPGEGLEGLNLMEVLGKCLPAAVLISGPEQTLAALNPSAEKLLQLPSSNLPNRSLDILAPAVRDVIHRTFRERTSQTFEIALVDEAGGKRPIHISTSLFPVGERFGVVAVLHDLAPARNLEQHLHHLGCLASIGTLSAGMAHEIKNALVAVKTFTDLLIQQNQDAELAGTVGRELTRIDSIVSQMLRFAGPAKPMFATLHLHEVVEHSLRLVEHQLAAKKIRLNKSLAGSHDLIRGDSYQLEQVLLNLFFNAIQAMAPGGELFVSTELSSGTAVPAVAPDVSPAKTHAGGGTPAPLTAQLCLRVRDTGPGIPPENIPRLFDPFFTTKKKGVGLGLSITRRIVLEHNGTIGVESVLNQGTTFTLLFPPA